MSPVNLFEEWKRIDEKNIFVRDGIINLSLYNNSDFKILSILPNAPDYSVSLDFCQEIEDEFFYEYDATEEQKINRYHPIRGMFFNLARWIYAINRIYQNKIPLFSDVCCQGIKEYGYSRYFRSSAILFLNKFKPKGINNERKLAKIAFRDQKLIDRQIKEIKPSLILCAGTFKVYRKIYERDIFEQIENTNFYIHKIYGSKEIRYVYSANNPEAKKKANEMFEDLLSDFLNEKVKETIVRL